MNTSLETAVESRKRKWDKNTLSHYERILSSLPVIESTLDLKRDAISIHSKKVISREQTNRIKNCAHALIPWRKGPFDLFGIYIDGEWRSDFKWNRLKKHLPSLTGKTILDIGCNNGYFMFKMAAENPRRVLGIDPVLLYCKQFEFLQNFACLSTLSFLPLGVEHLPLMEKNSFDVIFSMGIIYHHKNPLEQLIHMKDCLKKQGVLILEGLGIPGEESICLFPKGRYARMKNVWFVPTLSCLINWIRRTGFEDIQVIYSLPLSVKEQRTTRWMSSEGHSLKDFLHKENPEKTIEGYPAPWRVALKAKKPSW